MPVRLGNRPVKLLLDKNLRNQPMNTHYDFSKTSIQAHFPSLLCQLTVL